MIVDESLKLAVFNGKFIRMRKPDYSVRIIVAHVAYLIRAAILFTNHEDSLYLVAF